MKGADAAALIAPAVRAGERWADLGAGRGTFTRALRGLVGDTGSVLAVERDADALRSLRLFAARDGVVRVVDTDFTQALDLPPLDGILLANALHFVPPAGQGPLLATLARTLAPGGRLLVVEYDDRPPSPWVPYPVSPEHLQHLAAAAALPPPRELARVPSRYGGGIYAAVLDRR